VIPGPAQARADLYRDCFSLSVSLTCYVIQRKSFYTAESFEATKHNVQFVYPWSGRNDVTMQKRIENKSVFRKSSLEGSSRGCYLILKLKPAVSGKPCYFLVGMIVKGGNEIINWRLFLYTIQITIFAVPFR
jgi:hypothetical protein